MSTLALPPADHAPRRPVALQRLAAVDREAITQHLIALPDGDRHLRFGAALSAGAIEAYVSHIAFARDAVFGVRDTGLRLVATAHVAFAADSAELGLSVLPASRRQGVGGALLLRAAAHARSRGRRTLLVHCLTENAAMVRLAQQAGMTVSAAWGESDGMLVLPEADVAVLTAEIVSDQLGWYDYGLKAQVALWSRIGALWAGLAAVPDASPDMTPRAA